MAEVQYDDILLNITSKLDTRGLDSAVRSLQGLQSIKGFSGLKQASKDLNDFVSALDGINNKRMRTITNLANAMKGLGGAKKSLKVLADTSAQSNPLNDTSVGGGVAPSLDEANSQAQELSGAMKKTKEEAEKASKATKDIGKEAEKSSSFLGKMWAKFKSIAQYRAIREIINAIVNGLKEGVKNLEDWDRAIGGTGFAEAMDDARVSLTLLKNSLAVIVAPGLEWLIGVLKNIASWAIVTANAISRFLAILRGSDRYRIVKNIDALASSESKAGSSAKKATAEFKKQLMAFDEINNITEQNSGGSGGGGGAGISGSVDDMFGELDVGDMSKVEQWFYNAGEAWRKGMADLEVRLKTGWENLKRINEEYVTNFGADYQEKAENFNKALKIDGLVEWLQKAYSKFIGFVKDAFMGMIVYSKASKDIAIAYAEALVKAMGLALNTLAVFLKGGDWKQYWSEGINQIKDDLDAKVTGAVNKAKESVDKLFNKKYALNFDTSDAKKVNDTVLQTKDYVDYLGKTHTVNVTSQGIDATKDSIEAIKKKVDDLTGKTYNVNVRVTENVTRYVDEKVSYYGTNAGMYYTQKAGGGFVNTGEMFLARESGPELVGRIGSATAVANNDQIVQAVSQGVASAVSAVLGGQTSNVTVTLEGDAKGLFKVVQKEGRAYSARTGQPAWA